AHDTHSMRCPRCTEKPTPKRPECLRAKSTHSPADKFYNPLKRRSRCADQPAACHVTEESPDHSGGDPVPAEAVQRADSGLRARQLSKKKKNRRSKKSEIQERASSRHFSFLL